LHRRNCPASPCPTALRGSHESRSIDQGSPPRGDFDRGLARGSTTRVLRAGIRGEKREREREKFAMQISAVDRFVQIAARERHERYKSHRDQARGFDVQLPIRSVSLLAPRLVSFPARLLSNPIAHTEREINASFERDDARSACYATAEISPLASMLARAAFARSVLSFSSCFFFSPLLL